MNENIKWIAAAVAVVGLSIGAVLYFGHVRKTPQPAPAEPVATLPPPMPAAEEPAIKHPVPVPERAEPLPPLAESDVPVQKAFSDLLGNESVQRFMRPENLVRHIVVTVDNLPEQKVAQRLRPVLPVTGMFGVGGPEDEPVLDPANYTRYEPMLNLLRNTDTQRLIAAYTRYYPLFQEAYESLGHPPEYFNDRLVEVIDHLLETPEVQGPIALTRPGVLYEYADPKLEALSAGQKVLLRMGSANAATVKAKLRELRTALLAESGSASAPAPESPPAN
jgi:hypothetical protein